MGRDSPCIPGRAAGGLEADFGLQEIEENHTDPGTDSFVCHVSNSTPIGEEPR